MAFISTKQGPLIKRPIFRDRHFYILLAFFFACTLFYYFGELVNFFGWESLRRDIFYTVHDLHRMLFLVPILYSSYYYRSRGALLANVISLFIFLPRAFFISPYPDATLRMIAFVIMAAILSALTVMLVNRRDNLNKSVEALKQSEEKYRNILNQMYDSYYEVDLAGNFTFVNDATCLNLGYSREELIGNSFQIALSENAAKTVFEAYHTVYESGEPNKGFAFEVTRKDGMTGFAESSVSLRKNERGKIIGFRSISQDITERKQAEEALRISEEKYRSLIENINDVFYALDTEGNISYVSPVVERLTQYKVSDLIGKPFIPLIYPDDLPALLESFDRLVSGHLEPWEFRVVDKDGRIIFVRTSSRPLYKDGEIVGVTALMTDITEHKKAEGDIQQRAALLDAAYDSIIAYDMEGKIIYANEAACSLRGYTREEMLAMNMRKLVPQEELPNLEKRQKLLAEQGELSSEAVHIKKNGEVFLVDTHLRLLELAGNKLTIAAHRDITERKQMEQKLEALATHDFLTGLPNRVLLTDRFNIAAALARRNKSRLAVMSLDLDKFKTINDTLGHQAGDQVLKTISARLAGITRASDTIARVGGDEFVLVMLEASRVDDAASIGQKILDAFADPLLIDGHPLNVSTSIGIAIYPEDAQDLETLIKQSDAAMYFSKGHGRNRFKFFSDGDVSMGGDHRSGPPVRG